MYNPTQNLCDRTNRRNKFHIGYDNYIYIKEVETLLANLHNIYFLNISVKYTS